MVILLPPMDVAVESNRNRRARKTAKLSFMGEGLLDRARSTTLALLGGVAAIGLGAIGLALDQEWPLPPDSPLPAERPVAGKPGGQGGPTGDDSAPGDDTPTADRVRRASPVAPAERGGTGSGPLASGDGGESVATSSPVATTPSGGDRQPSRPAKKPQVPAGPKPLAQPVSNPSSPQQSQPGLAEPEPTPEPEPETATASAAPGNGNAWGWDNGKAKGHDRDRGDRDDDGERGGGWGRGH